METTKERPKRLRRVVIAVAAFLGITGAAVAAFFLTAGVTGQIKSGSMDAQWSTSNPTLTYPQGQTGAFWDNATVSGNKLNLTGGKAYLPGDKVVVSGSLQVAGNTTGQVVGIDLGTLPNGVVASLPSGMCGKPLTPNQWTPVSFSVEATDTAAMNGATYTLPSTAGIKVAPFDSAFSGPC